MSNNEFIVEAFYDALENVLKEAAAYVMANGHRKQAEIEDETPAMIYHRETCLEAIKRFNRYAGKVFVKGINDPEVFFFDFIANTKVYKHKITKGPRANQIEERTVSSARIEGYRKVIKAQRKLGEAISAQDIERQFRETKAYTEISAK